MIFNLRQFLFWFGFVVLETIILFLLSFTPPAWGVSLNWHEQLTVDIFMFLLTFGSVFALPVLRHDLFHSHHFSSHARSCSICPPPVQA
jgi:hypothetical protein